jgi:Cdc6-like AAA superfamily ATPase
MRTPRPLSKSAREELSRKAGRVFTPHAPVDERSLFAGRAEQLTQVLDAVNTKGRHAVIYGERGVGKTSLSNVLSSYFHNPKVTVLSPRVNCDVLDSFSSIWQKVFSEIDMHRPSAGFTTNYQRYSSVLLLPQGKNKVQVAPDDVRRLLALLSVNSLPILIIDEFDRLKRAAKRAFADCIKNLSDHAVNATVVLVGVADTVDQLIEEHRSIERALLPIRMPRMSNDEIMEILKTGFKKLGMRIDGEALHRIVVLSQGLPHYTHLLGLFSSRTAIDSGLKQIFITHVDNAITRALHEAQQTIRDGWHRATVSARKDNLFSQVLMACALTQKDELGYFAAQHIRDPLRKIAGKKYEIPSFAQHLNDFSDEKRGNILEKRGSRRNYRYRFNNPLMQPFVIMQGFACGKITSNMLSQG